MINILKEVANLFVQKNLGVLGTDLFIDEMPEKPSNCAAILELPSAKYNPFAEASRRTIAIYTRAESSVKARTRCWGLFDAVNDSTEDASCGFIKLNGRMYPYTCANTPHKVGKDTQGRVIFMFLMYIIYHD